MNRQARRAYDLLYLLTFRELKLRYQDTFFGYLWSLIRPLLQGAVLYVVLSKFIRIDVEDYGLVLLAALFPVDVVPDLADALRRFVRVERRAHQEGLLPAVRAALRDRAEQRHSVRAVDPCALILLGDQRIHAETGRG